MVAAEQTCPGIAQAAVEDTCTGAAQSAVEQKRTGAALQTDTSGQGRLLINKINK